MKLLKLGWIWKNRIMVLIEIGGEIQWKRQVWSEISLNLTGREEWEIEVILYWIFIYLFIKFSQEICLQSLYFSHTEKIYYMQWNSFCTYEWRNAVYSTWFTLKKSIIWCKAISFLQWQRVTIWSSTTTVSFWLNGLNWDTTYVSGASFGLNA